MVVRVFFVKGFWFIFEISSLRGGVGQSGQEASP